VIEKLSRPFVSRLSRKPVLHSCGHFEARLMSQPVYELGYVKAQSVCSSCDAQGRPVQKNYATLEEVKAACEIENSK
jgi:hypothetical protein